jgi:N-acetylglucosamine-6-phosphate deacetylase
VTSFLPTVTTLPLEEYASVTKRIVGQSSGDSGSRVLGIHLEGPYLNRKRRGAHPAEWLRTPALSDLPAYVTDEFVRMVTLAPELPGGYDVISALSERGLVLGLGHTEATEAETVLAIQHGAAWGTHLFNAMRPLDHREPGIAGVLLTDSRIKAGLIADCIHVHPRLLRMAYELRGHEGIVLMTDGSAVSGLPPGEYQFGQRKIIMDGVSARLENGSLVGSILTPDQAVRNMVSFAGVSIQKALVMASTGPAKLVGRYPEVGSFRSGSYADIVVFDSALRVKTTIVGGKTVFGDRKAEAS